MSTSTKLPKVISLDESYKALVICHWQMTYAPHKTIAELRQQLEFKLDAFRWGENVIEGVWVEEAKVWARSLPRKLLLEKLSEYHLGIPKQLHEDMIERFLQLDLQATPKLGADELQYI